MKTYEHHEEFLVSDIDYSMPWVLQDGSAISKFLAEGDAQILSNTYRQFSEEFDKSCTGDMTKTGMPVRSGMGKLEEVFVKPFSTGSVDPLELKVTCQVSFWGGTQSKTFGFDMLFLPTMRFQGGGVRTISFRWSPRPYRSIPLAEEL